MHHRGKHTKMRPFHLQMESLRKKQFIASMTTNISNQKPSMMSMPGMPGMPGMSGMNGMSGMLGMNQSPQNKSFRIL